MNVKTSNFLTKSSQVTSNLCLSQMKSHAKESDLKSDSCEDTKSSQRYVVILISVISVKLCVKSQKHRGPLGNSTIVTLCWASSAITRVFVSIVIANRTREFLLLHLVIVPLRLPQKYLRVHSNTITRND